MICGLAVKAAATRLGIQLIVVLKTLDGGWGSLCVWNLCKKGTSCGDWFG